MFFTLLGIKSFDLKFCVNLNGKRKFRRAEKKSAFFRASGLGYGLGLGVGVGIVEGSRLGLGVRLWFDPPTSKMTLVTALIKQFTFFRLTSNDFIHNKVQKSFNNTYTEKQIFRQAEIKSTVFRVHGLCMV